MPIDQLLIQKKGHNRLTDLRLDVTPFSRSFELDKLVVQLFSHVDDSVGHSLDLGQPVYQL
jgi:hypothetical protein